jgi:hypothetical protein
MYAKKQANLQRMRLGVAMQELYTRIILKGDTVNEAIHVSRQNAEERFRVRVKTFDR